MDYALDLIATLSRWSRSHLSDISLAIMATLLVLFGPAINAWVQQRIGSLNFVFRTLLFVLICAVGYGLAMVFVTPWLAKGLGYFKQLHPGARAPASVLRDRHDRRSQLSPRSPGGQRRPQERHGLREPA
ncbi:membrane protein [Pseudomonas aeruginosa]|nr:membrane protein [Pseudomonas aeruginosa]